MNKTYYLGDLFEITSSKRIKMSDYVSSGIPFYRSKEIINLHKLKSIQTELFISNSQFKKIKDTFGVPVQGDILLTSVGTLGIPYQVKEHDNFYFKDGNITWFKNFSDKIDKKYIYFWLISKIAKRKLDEITIGSTQKALTIEKLKKITINLPSIKEQKYIAYIIGNINKKIELNNKKNKTLTKIITILFKSWFIDFDPVRLKVKKRSTDQLKEVIDLFPVSFEDSGLRKIPKGWELKKLGSIISFLGSGKRPKGGASISKNQIPSIGAENINFLGNYNYP